MNYAERCRAEAAYYRRKDETCAKSHARLIALLDAAAGLWEAGDGMRDQMAEAMAAADAARYRWLRDKWFIEGGLFPWQGLDLHHDGFPPISHFDEAIDAAMAPRSGGEGEQS